MFTTGHLASGVAVGLALGLDGWPLAVLVLAAVFTDWDYGIQMLTGVNHRERLTHAPLVVLPAIAALAIWQPLAWWALVGSALHFSMDLFDYGLRLNPLSRKITGFRWLRCAPDAPFATYMRTYFGDARFLALEVGWALAAVAAVVARAADML